MAVVTWKLGYLVENRKFGMLVAIPRFIARAVIYVQNQAHS